MFIFISVKKKKSWTIIIVIISLFLITKEYKMQKMFLHKLSMLTHNNFDSYLLIKKNQFNIISFWR